MIVFDTMIERAHLEALRIAAETAFSSTNDEEADNARKQIEAILELEKTRREIFARFGVSDIVKPHEAKAIDFSAGPLLRKLREKAGLTQIELAELIGLHKVGLVDLNMATSIQASENYER